ncbi:ABC transporter substrate-binding protein [Verticiella sediminum]
MPGFPRVEQRSPQGSIRKPRAARRFLARAGALAFAALLCSAEPAGARDFETVILGPPQASDTLTIEASTDTRVFRGVLEDFSSLHPAMRLVYTELPTQLLYDGVIGRARDGERPGGPDLVISSSMDLQTKLANDGHARAHTSPDTQAVADWANWRDEVYSIGAEALVIAYRTDRLPAEQAPHTRGDLLAMLRAPGGRLSGRIGTYDVERSGIGYLAATQDARLDSMAGALLAALGSNRARVEESADATLDHLASGEIVLAYNMLESYAQRRIDDGAPIAVVRPADYTLVLSRAAVIPHQASRPDLGARFLDYLLSERGQHVIVRESGMLPVRASMQAAHALPSARPIGLGVGLLVYLDELKRGHFIDAWRAALCLDCTPGAPAPSP